eukprot:CAMPEP_0204620468 /NCGR_PEP_ID=MMETSP0717-20131115/6494_1 /ASSEMBLY_ACC=CAM_ASM_000666 /TAXON_ID=230516 /ORGANISM="Chaetoceros curvisetus" /LENGTH=258 /DNA_ID=CAMNT_0051634675 /DNA_START=259 /DNA_END=1035 /DNA_ORIENTATION=-
MTDGTHGSAKGDHVNAEYSLLEDKDQKRIRLNQSSVELVLKHDDDEVKEWDIVERSVDRYAREVRWSAQFTAEKLKVVHSRVGNDNFKTFEECYEGFEPAESSENMNTLNAIAIENIQKFGVKIGKRLHEEYRKKMNIATGALLCAVIGVLSRILCTSPSVQPTSKVTMREVVTAEAFIAFGVGVYQAISSHVLKIKTERAMAYLRQTEYNVSNLSRRLTASKFTKSGAIYDRELIQEQVKNVIKHLHDSIDLCDEVI